MPAYALTADLREYLDQVAGWTQQTIEITGNPDGGSLTLDYGGQVTGSIARAASAATVQTALTALSTIGANNAKVAGPLGGPWVVKLAASLTDSAMPLVLNSNSLTGGTAPNVTISKATEALLQDCLDRARDTLDTLLGFSFFDAGAAWPSASAKTVRSEESEWLRLPPYQEGSITLLTLADDTTPMTDYEEEWDAGRFYLSREDGWGGLRYSVTATYGYGPAPAAVVELNLELAVNIWRAKSKGMFTELMGAEGGGQIRFVGGLTKQQLAIVAGIRRQFVDVSY